MAFAPSALLSTVEPDYLVVFFNTATIEFPLGDIELVTIPMEAMSPEINAPLSLRGICRQFERPKDDASQHQKAMTAARARAEA